MTQPDFYTILENEILLKEVQIKELDEIIATYPYAANLFILKARVLHIQLDERFKVSLENAAARTISRSKLHELIEGKPEFYFELKEVSDSDSIIEEVTHDNSEEIIPETEINLTIADSRIESNEDPGTLEIENSSSEILAVFSEPETGNDVTKTNTEGQEDLNIDIRPNQKTPPQIAKLNEKKNDFSFSFIKVSAGKSAQNEILLIPSQVYDINMANGGKKSKSKKKEDSIIEKFLESSPSISPPTIEFGQTKKIADLAANSGKLTEEIITENMAMIYLKQKNYSKALEIYRKLKLKNPEKGDYFAALIKNLENKIV